MTVINKTLNAFSVETGASWNAIMQMRNLFPTDHDQITENQKMTMWKIMAKHSNVVLMGPHA